MATVNEDTTQQEDKGLPFNKDQQEDNVQRYTEELKLRKNKQTAAISAITKKRHELYELTKNSDNLHLVKSGLKELEQLSSSYYSCHQHYQELLEGTEESDVQEANAKRYDEHQLVIMAFRSQTQNWIHDNEVHLQDDIDNKSQCSRRSCSQKSGSYRSDRSESSSSRVHAKAKVAGLLAKKDVLKNKEALLRDMCELKVKQDLLSAKEAMLSLDADIEEAKARERVFEESAMAENAPTADQPLVTSHQTTASAVSDQSSVVPSVPIGSTSSSIPNRQQSTKIIVASSEYSKAPFVRTGQGMTVASAPSGQGLTSSPVTGHVSFVPQSSMAPFIPTVQGTTLASAPLSQGLTSSSVTGHVSFVPQSSTAPFLPTVQGTTLASAPSGQGLTSSPVTGHVSFVPQSSTAPFLPTVQGTTLASAPSGQGLTSSPVTGHVSFVPQSSMAPFIPTVQGTTLASAPSSQGLTSSSVTGHVSFVPQSSTAPFLPTVQGTTLASAPSGQGLTSSPVTGHVSFVPQSSTAPFLPTVQGTTLASAPSGQGLTSSPVTGHVSFVPQSSMAPSIPTGQGTTFASAQPHQGLVSALLPNQRNMFASVAGQASSVPGQQPTATSHDLLLRTHQQLAAAMVLPHAEVPTFKGDILEFVPFMMAFETRIVPHTSRDSR